MKHRGWEKPIRQQAALAMWAQLVGPVLAGKCPAVEIDGDILWIKAKGAAWRSEISFQKDEILAKMNANIKPYPIKDIRFLV